MSRVLAENVYPFGSQIEAAKTCLGLGNLADKSLNSKTKRAAFLPDPCALNGREEVGWPRVAAWASCALRWSELGHASVHDGHAAAAAYAFSSGAVDLA